MISLRKAMEEQREELLRSALDCCCGVVGAIAENGARVCPPVADTFQTNLVVLCERLTAATVPLDLSRTEQDIGRELNGWGTRASEYYRRKAGEIRDARHDRGRQSRGRARRTLSYAQFVEV